MASNYGDLTGQTLGTCVLERLIGQGGMGSVYLAQQMRPSRRVAVKVLQPNLAMNSEIYQEFIIRFRREADVIARLEHVNIMPIYEYGEQNNLAYLVMPYFAGGSLRDVLSKRHMLTLEEATTYTEQAASALDYAHAQGVIHRDLKPANFLLAGDGRLVLADFGIARIMEESAANSSLTGTGTILGTPEYMAPEMARGEAIDYHVDIYELGVVLFQMLSGRVPFSASTPIALIAKHIQEPVPLLQRENPTFSPAIDTVIQRATAKYANDRYNSATAMARALRAASTAGAPVATYYDQDNNIPTVRSSGNSLILPPPTSPQYNTPPIQLGQPNTIPPAPSWDQNGNQYAASYYNPQAGGYGNYTTPAQPYQPQRRNRGATAAWVVGIFLILALLGTSGVLAAMHFSQQGNTGTTNITPPAPQPNASAGTTTQPTPTPNATPTTAPTQQPTAQPSPSAVATQPTSVTPGQQLYIAIAPGPNCDKAGGTWTKIDNTQITCQGLRTKISNTGQAATLEGIFLTQFPQQAAYAANTYPADYDIRVRLQQLKGSTGDFGVYFRNNQQGTYAFILHADGSWTVSLYTYNGGQATVLTQGTNAVNDTHNLTNVHIIVQGQQFTFFVNGKQLGTANDATYANGTAGIAVGPASTIDANNFVLAAPAQ